MKKGATLIELLIVGAFIALLTWVVVINITKDNTPTQNSIEDFKSTDMGIALPEPTNYVVDTAGVLTTEQLQAINTLLASSTNPSKIQIAVLIATTTKPLSIEQYGIRLAEKWKVGYKGSDNGAIIIIATQDRKVRIEVGNGLEGSVTDAQAESILQTNMVPKLKSSDWYGAIFGGISGLNNLVK